jgi:hypothetical protein
MAPGCVGVGAAAADVVEDDPPVDVAVGGLKVLVAVAVICSR